MPPLHTRFRDGEWKGRPAYVIGSGPSRRGLDLVNVLRGHRSIGCNEEYRAAPTVAICQDVRFFHGDGSRKPAKSDPAWYAYGGTPVFFRGHPDRPDPPYDDMGIIYEVPAATVPSPEHGGVEFVWGKTLRGKGGGLFYGANCGLAALNLADILGADPIYLVGFDCASRNGKTSSHSHYPSDWCMDANEFADQVYALWAKDFRAVAKFVRAKVYNCCPWSGIDAFEKLPHVPVGAQLYPIEG